MYKIVAISSLVLAAVILAAVAIPQTKTLLQSPLASNEPAVPFYLTENQFTPEPLSLHRIFAEDHRWTATLAADRIRSMIATGDVLPARSVNAQVLKYNDFTWPYLKTADLLKSADVTFINLETPLLRECPVTNEGMVFCGDSRHVNGLKFAGVDIVTLANNHTGNHDIEGVDETQQALTTANIVSVGRSGPAIYPLGGLRLAFLGYNDINTPQPGIANVTDELIKKDIAVAQSQADYVIVSYHWGAEYRAQPDERQKYLGHMTIDAGADLIIGNHPHWIQPVELYKGKLITYAHGNFVFDQMWSQKTREGVVGRYTFYDDHLIDVEFTPVRIDDFGQPTIPDKKTEQRILREMKNESEQLQKSTIVDQ